MLILNKFFFLHEELWLACITGYYLWLHVCYAWQTSSLTMMLEGRTFYSIIAAIIMQLSEVGQKDIKVRKG
jgi:hypothetical protein